MREDRVLGGFVWLLLALLLMLLCFPRPIDGQSKKFACSYGHRKALEQGYLPEYVPVEICTHVVYKYFSFPKFVARQMLFEDSDKQLFARLVTSVRQRSSTIRVVASIDGASSDFSDTSGTNVRRRAFTQAVSALFLELDADAVELNWANPGAENSGQGVATDRLTMVTLLQDLRQVVNAASRLISGRPRELWIHGSVHPNLVSSSYNTLDVCELVDHVTLHAVHGPLQSRQQVLPAIAGIPGGPINLRDGLTDATQTWIDNGCPPKKLLLGIHLQGVLQSVSSFFAQSLSANLGNPFATTAFLSYGQVCQTVRQQPGWSVGWDRGLSMPYATRSLQSGQTQRISYEDVASLHYKLDLVEQKRLGGVFVDFIHSDDIYGSCGQAHALSGYIAYRLQAIPSDIGFAIEWN